MEQQNKPFIHDTINLDEIRMLLDGDIDCSLTLDDETMLYKVAAALNAKIKVKCTGCSYCMPCPKGVDIPGCFAAYNQAAAEGRFWGTVEYIKCTTLRKNPTSASNCVECGLCEKHCPQHIEIRKELKAVKKYMETPIYRFARKCIGKLGKF